MPRKELMSYEGEPYFRWVKMYRGVRYRISCADLRCPLFTREGTYKLANEWWVRKLAELNGPTAAEQERRATLARLREEVRVCDDTLDAVRAVLLPKEIVPVEDCCSAAIDEFLSLERAKGAKPKTYKELLDVMAFVRGWWGEMPCREVNETKLLAAFTNIAGMDIVANTRKKRWNIVKRFVCHLVETARTTLPVNLHSKKLKFKQGHRVIPTWTTDEVRAQYAALTHDRYRLYAALALNCGMNNIDIAELTKDMVKDGVLTRRRVKTGDIAKVPTVSYPLWAETRALLEQFYSDHDTLWLTARPRSGVTGAKLVTAVIDEKTGTVKEKDLVSLNWRRYSGASIPLMNWRTIAGTELRSMGANDSDVDHFLGHAPEGVLNKHYAATTDERIFPMVEKLRLRFFPE